MNTLTIETEETTIMVTTQTEDTPNTARNVLIGLISGMVLGAALIATEATTGFAMMLVSLF